MNQLPTISLVCKPHVAKYLSCILETKSGQYHVIEKGLFWAMVKTKLTDDHTQRIKEIPEEYTSIKLVLPRNYRKHFFAADKIRESVDQTEEFFWNGAIMYISNQMANHHVRKEAAIERFYREFNLCESLYSVETMRRQLHRKDVLIASPKIKFNRYSTKFSDETVLKIAALYEKKTASGYLIAEKFQISESYVRKLHKKVYNPCPICA